MYSLLNTSMGARASSPLQYEDVECTDFYDVCSQMVWHDVDYRKNESAIVQHIAKLFEMHNPGGKDCILGLSRPRVLVKGIVGTLPRTSPNELEDTWNKLQQKGATFILPLFHSNSLRNIHKVQRMAIAELERAQSLFSFTTHFPMHSVENGFLLFIAW